MAQKHQGFWIGGVAGSRAFKSVLEETKDDLVSEDPQKKLAALVKRASAFYSRSFGGLIPWHYAAAKKYLYRALREKGAVSLSANQCQTLADIALAGTPADCALARDLAGIGIATWESNKNPIHTRGLLYLNLVESSSNAGLTILPQREKEALQRAEGIALAMAVGAKSLHEQRQLVRIRKRIGAVHWLCGDRRVAQGWLDAASGLARECSPDQVRKIQLLRLRLWLGM